VEFDRPVISVGNLSMGGTGKTPMIEWLIRELKGDHKLATISRGYRRKTSGFRLAGEQDDASTLGDEPYQFYLKFGADILVSVCEERILAVPEIVQDHEDVAVFLLDDAYQHRKIHRDFNILLTAFDRPFYNDFVVPAGGLREGRKGAARADAIIVTKCPATLADEAKQQISSSIKQYSGDRPVYFSHIGYDQPVRAIGDQVEMRGEVIVITGIARPDGFVAAAKEQWSVIRHFDFQDHYAFRAADLDKMLQTVKDSQKPVSLLTTEKDMVRLLSFREHPLFQQASLFYIPIRFVIDKEDDFRKQVLKVLELH
jgi:tetraacyldisaccharide 4'-kinase